MGYTLGVGLAARNRPTCLPIGLKIELQKKSLATTTRRRDIATIISSSDDPEWASPHASSILRHVAHVLVDEGAHLRRRLHHRAHLLAHVGRGRIVGHELDRL